MRAKASLFKAGHAARELQESFQGWTKELAKARWTVDERIAQILKLEQKLAEDGLETMQMTGEWTAALQKSQGQPQESRRKLRAVKMQLRRALTRTIKGSLTRHKGLAFKLLHKGVYTKEARALARFLVQAGCSQASIGVVIEWVTHLAGAPTKRRMSSRTVSRALMEGGVAACIQLGYEITQAKGLWNVMVAISGFVLHKFD